MRGGSVCFGCTERWVTAESRCHQSCERYLRERQERDRQMAEARQQREGEADADGFRHDAVQRTKRHKHGGRKGG